MPTPVTERNATGLSAHFCAANRTKRSITVDISTVKGQDIVRQLAARATQLGRVYCSISGCGQYGPNRYLPVYDLPAVGNDAQFARLRCNQAGGDGAECGICHQFWYRS